MLYSSGATTKRIPGGAVAAATQSHLRVVLASDRRGNLTADLRRVSKWGVDAPDASWTETATMMALQRACHNQPSGFAAVTMHAAAELAIHVQGVITQTHH